MNTALFRYTAGQLAELADRLVGEAHTNKHFGRESGFRLLSKRRAVLHLAAKKSA